MSEEKKKMEKELFDTEEYKKMIKANNARTELASEVNTNWTPAPEPVEAPTDNNPPESNHVVPVEEDTSLTGTARAILEQTLKNPRVDKKETT